MDAIILSAGQGRRLLPLTANDPKCLLPLRGRSVLEWQIDTLLDGGIDRITVVVGYNAAQVEALLGDRYGGDTVRTVFNPFYEVADNLASCWMARRAFHDDVLLVNGDTLFEPAVLGRMTGTPVRPITVAVDTKSSYDADDMKVVTDGDRLQRIGKHLPAASVDGESIGMLAMRGEGSRVFRGALDRLMREPESLNRWYLSVIDDLAREGWVWTCSVDGLEWGEVDFPLDYEKAKRMVAGWQDGSTEVADRVS